MAVPVFLGCVWVFSLVLVGWFFAWFSFLFPRDIIYCQEFLAEISINAHAIKIISCLLLQFPNVVCRKQDP